MSNFFIILFLISPILLVISLAKPKLINGMVKKDFSRKQLAGIFGALLIASFVGFGITSPSTTKTPASTEQAKTELKDQTTGEVSGVNNLIVEEESPSPQPTPSPTPVLSPSPIVFLNPSLKPSPSPPPKIAATTAPDEPSSSSCHPSYTGACLDANASDYDCLGGSGNGPKYTGKVNVVGPDVFDLDRDKDGIGCD